MSVAKKQIRQIISENNLNSVTDVYALLRDSFNDSNKNSWRLSWICNPWL